MTQFRFLVPLLLGMAVQAQAPAGYYASIQAHATSALSDKAFRQLEVKARAEASNPRVYEALSDAFLGTTEKIWAVVYAEAACNLDPAGKGREAYGARIAKVLQGSLTKTPDGASISLTQNVEVTETTQGVPFENNYEISFLLSTVTSGATCFPLNLAALHLVRRAQLETWREKALPLNSFLQGLLDIMDAGHLEAYHYWLFGSAFPAEAKAWNKDHAKAQQQWLGWLAQHPFKVDRPDFHRPLPAEPVPAA